MSVFQNISDVDTIWGLPNSTLCLEVGFLVSSTILLITCWTFILYIYRVFIVKTTKGKKFLGLDDVPGDAPFMGLNFIGNFVTLMPISKAIENGIKMTKRYPGLLRVSIMNKIFVVFTDPVLIQQLFKSADFGHNVKSPYVYDPMKPLITNGLLVSKGKFWQGQRKIMMRTQSFQSLKAYMSILNSHSRELINSLGALFKDGKPHAINETVNVTFLQVICEMITGSNNHYSNELSRYHHNFETWKESIVTRALYPWLQLNIFWRLHPLSRRVDKAVGEMIDFAKNRLKEHKEKRTAELSEDLDNPSFRSLLHELTDAGGDDDQIVDEVNTMLFGGHETGATAIHFFCFLMSCHPHIQRQCQQEIDDLYENPECTRNGDFTYEAIQSNMKYVERCIQETLRVFPPIFLIARQLQTEFLLEQGENAFRLPVGSNLIITPFITHRNEEYYPDPEKFDPDRFLPEEIAKRHACAFVPFSGGPRNCLGLKFAMMELKVVAVYLLRHFEMSTKDRMEDVKLLPHTTLTPAKDFTFEFKKRQIFDRI